MELAGQDVSIAGAGVAGLAAAAGLAGLGARVRVFERAAAPGSDGGGLQISPNGLAALDALGLLAHVRAVSLRAEAVRLHDHRGGELARLPLAREYRLVHRPRLIDALLAGARAAGAEVTCDAALAPGGEGLRIAADGIGSAHRAALDPGRSAPRFTGQVAWRAVFADPGPDSSVRVFMGPGRHLVSYPLPGGLRNLVAVEERARWVGSAAGEGWRHEDDPARLRAAFAGFGGPVPGWLERVAAVHLWGLHLHPVAGRWQDGRSVLIGDAAHPTMPFLAQGANMALEDAALLPRYLAALPRPEALARFEAARLPRTRRIVAAAAANARAYHLDGAARLAAHAALRIASRVSPAFLGRRYAWIHAFDARAALT